MRSVDDQMAFILDAAMTPEPVRIAIANALGLKCAEEVQANQPLPGFPQAAIDGYAVRAVDVGGERPSRHAPATTLRMRMHPPRRRRLSVPCL